MMLLFMCFASLGGMFTFYKAQSEGQMLNEFQASIGKIPLEIDTIEDGDLRALSRLSATLHEAYESLENMASVTKDSQSLASRINEILACIEANELETQLPIIKEKCGILQMECQTFLNISSEYNKKISSRMIYLTMILACIGIFVNMRAIHEQKNSYDEPLQKLIEDLRKIVSSPNSYMRLDVKGAPQLEPVMSLVNNLLNSHTQEKDKNIYFHNKCKDAVMLAIDTFDVPTVVFSNNLDVFMQNNAANIAFEGDGGYSLFKHFKEAIAADKENFESHGMSFQVRYPVKTPPQSMIFICQMIAK